MSKPSKPALVPGRDISILLNIMARLRGPDGCPWDRAQNFASIAPYTIEEAYEVESAIRDGDMAALPGELGDLLLQVVFHARMAEEAGLFDFGDVVAHITNKMVRRHPHVFGDARALTDGASVKDAWEGHKQQERAARGHASLLDDVASALPALMRAEKLQKRASIIGFDWNNANLVVDKIAEEAREVADARTQAEREEEVGDLLFAITNLARHLKVDPEAALRMANNKFIRRFNYIEQELKVSGKVHGGASLAEMEALWQRAKALEKQPGGG